MKQAEADSAERVHLGPGTLYGTIKRLISAGYIEESDERPDPDLDDQRRRYYRITPAGLSLLGAELERYELALQKARLGGVRSHHKPRALGA
jgi:DNA-binding PadR family transcriptional regulator